MISLMLMSSNVREKQILAMAFEQLRIKVIHSDPSYANYVQTLQYQPDIILMEIPRLHSEHLHFSGLIRKHKKVKKIPIIGYGDKVSEAEIRGYATNGVNTYIDRPLKFSKILVIIQRYLKLINKSIDKKEDSESKENKFDIEKLLHEDTLPTQKIDIMVGNISSILAFPFTVAKVLQLTQSSKSGARDLAKVIEADPVLSTNILKVSNTVFFASMNRRINSIKDAIVRIGFNETKRITMAMKVMELFDKEKGSVGFDRLEFWHHSLVSALIAEYFARRLHDVNNEEAFLAGLLHDFGIILLDEFFPSIFDKILEKTTRNGSRFIDNEINLLGISHNDVIKELFSSWKIPDSITEAIYKHYTICLKEKRLETAAEKLAVCTAMSNIIAKSMNIGASCDQYIIPLSNWLFESVKLPNGLGSAFYQEIQQELKVYREFLNIKLDPLQKNETVRQIAVFTPVRQNFIPIVPYLQSLGHTVVPIPPSDSYNDFHKKFDTICVWANKECSPESIAPLTRLFRRVNENSSEQNSNESIAPSLIFIHKDEPCRIKSDQKYISLMYNQCDLRTLDRNLSLIFEGNVVDCTTADKEKPSSDLSKPAKNATLESGIPLETAPPLETTTSE